ncbi:DEAD/DEAH box helicase [Cellulomonas oligotrophica]|uniref:DNA helicase n=1 Tax=Cellulomonas oligotrophica TaxID=931536 RepID=A0A7Y9FCM1_9CELL|nr:DEAD/DEAH box helicase [Cellulomonas oligotrophica]NYD84863.1 superfamily II DNA or RNA helicase [Cellulomonas oligotrophica]GIG31932.1 DNA helicase [Cellulomonas oligotrophica]
MPTDPPDLPVGHVLGDARSIAWREVLRTLAAPQPGPAGDGAGTGVLGLQLELRELTPHTRERWNGPTSRRVTAVRRAAGRGRAADGSPAAGTAPAGAGAEGGPATGMIRLGARPVLRTARGWARGNLTWSNVAHMRHRLDLDVEQHRWFCQLGAFHRAAGPAVPGADLDWVHLDDFTNPVLWDLLVQARELGVELVGSGAGSDVRLAGRADLDLDVVQEARGVVVRARLRIDGAPAPVAHAHAVGTHGVYVVDLARPNRVVLARAARTWSAQQLVLLGAGPEGGRELADVLAGGLVVPPDAAGELVKEHLPALLAGLDVVSADRTVALPPPAPPTLVLTVRHRPRRTVDLSWRWDGHARSAPAPDPRTLLPADVRAALGWPDAATEGTDTPALPGPVTLRDEDAAELVTTTLPRLDGLPGVRVETVGTAPDYRRLDGPPVLTVTTYETEKHDWFDLGVSVQVEGRAVPFAPLFAALAGGKRRLLLVDGTYLRLDHPVLAPLAALIAEARELAEWETGPRISRHQTSLWSDLVAVADEAVAAPAWQALLADVAQGSPRATPLPRGLRATLRPYQREGYDWLTSLWRHRIGGILADDMGLGKTLQCLALVQHAVEERAVDGHGADEPRRPFLVVAPTSVVPGWVAEAARFTPGLRVRRIRATEAGGGARVADAAADADLVVTSYALLRLDADAYRDVARGAGWAGLVLDEAQQVKNAASLVHAAARDLEVPFTLAVTGTPMENSLTELHALLALTVPGLFPSARGFVEQYVRPVEGVRTGITAGPGGGEDVGADVARVRTERLARLRRRVRPFLLRRTKELVAADLPAKQEQTLTVELTPAHREVYDRYLQRERAKLFGLIDDLDRQRFIVYRSLTLLRMLALDPALIDPALGGSRSAKLDTLLEQLEDVVAEGHRALVFSQFTSYLAIVGDALREAGVPFVQLDGSTVRREEVLEEFRTGAAPVFLISLKAGGTGLNLTEADYVFLLDPWWNPASEQQAVDRTHRIGQQRTVMVYRMIAAGTIEEKVVALQARKAALVDAVIDDGDLFSSALTADDVRELLA